MDPYTSSDGDFNLEGEACDAGSGTASINGYQMTSHYAGNPFSAPYSNGPQLLSLAINQAAHNFVSYSMGTTPTSLSLTDTAGLSSSFALGTQAGSENVSGDGYTPVYLGSPGYTLVPAATFTGFGQITIEGNGACQYQVGDPGNGNPYGVQCDSGAITLNVENQTATASYSQSWTPSLAASALNSAINSQASMPVSASVSGNIIALTSKVGSNTAFRLFGVTQSSSAGSGGYAGAVSFIVVPTAYSSVTGGLTISGNPSWQIASVPVDCCEYALQSVNDTGTVTVTVNGYSRIASYTAGTTASQLATSLVSAFNSGGASSPVTATASGSHISFSAKNNGAVTVSSDTQDTAYYDTGYAGALAFVGIPDQANAP